MRRLEAPTNASALLAIRRNQWRVGLVLLGLVVLVVTGWYASQQLKALEREALARTEVYARVLEGQVSRVVGVTANALRALAVDPLVTAEPVQPGAVARLLAQRLPGQPYLRSLSLLDRDGRVLASTTATDVGKKIDLARLGHAATLDGRERLGPLLQVRDLGELASDGSPSRVPGALSMVRSAATERGDVRWLVGLLNIDYFSTQHALITGDEPIRALMLDLEGTLISGTGDDGLAPGTALSSLVPVTRSAARQDHGSYIDAGSDAGGDAQRMLGAFRLTREWPLLLAAQIPYRVVQDEWQAQMTAAAGVALLLLALLAGMAGLAERGARRELQALAQLDQLNEEVARTEERWKLALDGAGHGVWDADLATGQADVSARLMALLGHSAQADVWSLQRWMENVHPDDQAPAIAATRRHLRGETPSLETELRMRSADGSWRWVLARGTRSGRPDAAGRGTRLVGTVTDISVSKAVEAALRESDALLDKTGRIGGIGGWQLDVATGLVQSTEQACRIHEVPVGSRGTVPQTLAFYPPQVRPTIQAAVEHALATGQGFDLELPFVTARGRRLWVRTVATAEREGDRVVRLVGALQDITERRQAEAELHEARQRELLIGARIQQALLVDAPDQRLPGLWLSTLNQASQGIDGDFVELISLGDRGIDIIVGDVMGKGVAAALMAAGTKMQFSRCVASLLAEPERDGTLPSPAEVVAAVHQAMTANLQALDAFVTLSYLRLDMLAGTITWVGCGHEEPLLLRQGGAVLSLANQHPPLGVLDASDYQQDVVPFTEGDALFLCSDGAADALMPDGSRLSRERVVALLSALMAQVQTPAAVLHALRRDLVATGARITDDLTLALAIASGPTQRASRRELPADLADLKHVRGIIEHRCREAGLAEVETSLFAVACVEAYTNAVRHTRGRPAGAPVELVVRVEPEAVVVDIVTLGEPFVPPAPAGETNFEDFPEGGFGLHIMQQASDALEYLHEMGVNTVRLIRLRRHNAG